MGFSAIGFFSAKLRAARVKSELSADAVELMIDREALALSSIVAATLKPGRGKHWSLILLCRHAPEVEALRRLTREQADFCVAFLSDKLHVELVVSSVQSVRA